MYFEGIYRNSQNYVLLLYIFKIIYVQYAEFNKIVKVVKLNGFV